MTTRLMILVRVLNRKTYFNPKVTASAPAMAGPATKPIREDMVRTAMTRPRFSGRGDVADEDAGARRPHGHAHLADELQDEEWHVGFGIELAQGREAADGGAGDDEGLAAPAVGQVAREGAGDDTGDGAAGDEKADEENVAGDLEGEEGAGKLERSRSEAPGEERDIDGNRLRGDDASAGALLRLF